MVRLKVDKTIKIVHSRFPMERVLKELEKEILLCSIRAETRFSTREICWNNIWEKKKRRRYKCKRRVLRGTCDQTEKPSKSKLVSK